MKFPQKVFMTVVFLFGQYYLFGQETKKFTYGGNGEKFKGTFQVAYFIENGNQRRQLEKLQDTIDLNEYSGPVKFLAQISDLRLGLNSTYSHKKNSDHPRVFYLELSRVNSSRPDIISPVGPDTVRISGQTGHYGPKIDQIAYGINNIEKKTTLLFRAKSRIIDGIYDRHWDGVFISKSIVVEPRTQVEKDSLPAVAQTTAHSPSRRKRQVSRYRDSRSGPDQQMTDTLQESETIEDKLWAKIEQDLMSDNKNSLLEKCRVYRMNCNQQIFTECKYSEDILFFMATLVAGQEKLALIKEYNTTYPSGKYRDRIEKLIVKPPETLIPTKADLAQLDFDRKAVLINRIKGGNRPYYVGFHDYNKNKEYAVKSIRFNKEDLYIDLETIEIPEGNYTVKVVDSKGQVFLEQPGIYVSKAMQIPKSVKLSGVLIFVGVLGFLYRKYIHF